MVDKKRSFLSFRGKNKVFPIWHEYLKNTVQRGRITTMGVALPGVKTILSNRRVLGSKRFSKFFFEKLLTRLENKDGWCENKGYWKLERIVK